MKAALSRVFDFSRSHFSFKTRNGGSLGTFAVEAVGTLTQRDRPEERFWLGTCVMAGNVFAQANLPCHPPYSFQIVVSREDHQIFRNYPDARAAGDSWDSNSSVFASIQVKEEFLSCKLLSPPENGTAPNPLAMPLVCRVSFPSCSSILSWGLEFPVKHLNVSEDFGRFQIETGPVHFPHFFYCHSDSVHPLGLAYLFFNRFDSVDGLFFGHTPVLSGSTRFFSQPFSRPAKVALFSVLPPEGLKK